jgi:hypothetical protein
MDRDSHMELNCWANGDLELGKGVATWESEQA